MDRLDVQGRLAAGGTRAAARPSGGPGAHRSEPAGDHRWSGSHRAPDGHRAELREGLERGRNALRPSRRAHRADGRLRGSQGDMAGSRGVARRAIGALGNKGKEMTMSYTGLPTHAATPAVAQAA